MKPPDWLTDVAPLARATAGVEAWEIGVRNATATKTPEPSQAARRIELRGVNITFPPVCCRHLFLCMVLEYAAPACRRRSCRVKFVSSSI